MSLVYLDANALMRWAEGQCDQPTADWARAADRVSGIIDDPGNTVQISELTFIEFHDQVLRYRAGPQVEWTEEWANAVQTQLMGWIEAGRIEVLPPAPRAFDVAMSYISMTREAGRALKAADAVHLARVIEWAHDAGEQVTMVTGDSAFRKFLDVFTAASDFVVLEEVVVTQPAEPGTAPAGSDTAPT